MHLLSEFYTVAKISANPSYTSNYVSLTDNFKLEKSIYNESDFESWKDSIDAQILSDLNIVWSDVAKDYRDYLVYIDRNLNEWREYSNSQFSEIDFDNAIDASADLMSPAEILAANAILGFPD